MESYVTRSVNDADLDFYVPDYPDDEIQWPISIKWPLRSETKSQNIENAEGEMNPELLLLYALERINMPAGEHMLQKLFKNLSVQLYFVYMFWLVKVKFFLNDKEENAEAFLLRKLSAEYVKIVEVLSKKAHGGNNKDFVFHYLPYIISNAVYYTFYFLCPGSRHMYSKGFRKTILMQVVQVMHGVQLCPVSVRVAWAKLFPEEEQDDIHDGEENDVLPMMIPLTQVKRDAGDTVGSSEFSTSRGVSPVNGIRPGSTPTRKGPVMDDEDVRLETKKMTDGDRKLTNSEDDPFFVKPDEVQDSSQVLTAMGTKIVEPVDRLSLRPPPTKSKFIVPRQRRERSDINDISPLMQQYLVLPTTGAGKRAQTLARTVPVNWCVAGGSDTHRRRHIPKELHDELSSKSRNLQRDYRRVTSKSHRRKVADNKSLDKMCTTIIGAGNGAVGRYSQDLVRKLKNCRGLADIEGNGDDTVAVPTLALVEDDDIFNENNSTYDAFL